jgi:hypothetical protein
VLLFSQNLREPPKDAVMIELHRDEYAMDVIAASCPVSTIRKGETILLKVYFSKEGVLNIFQRYPRKASICRGILLFLFLSMAQLK